jgi:hypothetical protein
VETTTKEINMSWNYKLFRVDPESATGSADAYPAEPAAAADQSATAVDAATGRGAGAAPKGQQLYCSAPHLGADHQDKAADL